MNNIQTIGSLDLDKINITEYYEVEHWSNEFHITPEELRSAVQQVGTNVADIRKYLNK